VRHNSLFVSRTTYFNRIKDGAITASVMDFDIDAKTGKVCERKAVASRLYSHSLLRWNLPG